MPAITVKPISRLLVHKYSWHSFTLFSKLNQSGNRLVLAGAWQKIGALVLFACAARAIAAQTLNVRINVTITAPARIRINAEFAKSADVVSFPHSYVWTCVRAERRSHV